MTEGRGINDPADVWVAGISQILSENAELAVYLNRIYGAAMVGLPMLHEFYILWGMAGTARAPSWKP